MNRSDWTREGDTPNFYTQHLRSCRREKRNRREQLQGLPRDQYRFQRSDPARGWLLEMYRWLRLGEVINSRRFLEELNTPQKVMETSGDGIPKDRVAALIVLTRDIWTQGPWDGLLLSDVMVGRIEDEVKAWMRRENMI